MRGSDVRSVLASQRDYTNRHTSDAKFGLMVPEAFVRGIRDLGYRSNGGAISELIDNALQAGAGRVDVVFGYEGAGSTNKPTQLAIVDNGHGMAPAMIRAAMMWGGTHRENDRTGLGRYGYGLPCASVSFGRRFTVYSRVSGGELYAVTLDLDSLAGGEYTKPNGHITVPKPFGAELPSFVAAHLERTYGRSWASGCIILIEKLDRLEWTTNHGLRENLRRRFGVTYQKLLGTVELYVDDKLVELIDPLFLTRGGHLYDLDADRAHALDPMRIEISDPNTRDHQGTIMLRYAWMPPSFGSVDKAREAVGINANARFSILRDYHGIIFSRNGRLIDVQTRTPWTTFVNNDRYIKVEVEFSATLDEAFGVTTSKQQVTVSPTIWDRLREAGLAKAIEQLRDKVREAKVERRLASLDPVTEERPAFEEDSANREPSVVSGCKRQFELELYSRPYRLRFEHIIGAPFFRVDRHGDDRTLILNTVHGFYGDIYKSSSSTRTSQAPLEVLLLGMDEMLLRCCYDNRIDYQRQLVSWSQRLEHELALLGLDRTRGDGDANGRPSGHQAG